MLASVAFDEDTSDDEEENGNKRAGEGDEDNEANGHVSAYVKSK